jgi:lipid-binding SYLF domain-containing protein
MAAAAGPYGAGASIESGTDRTPVLSYVRSRGLYAGIEILANAFICRFDENERVYHWKGITQKDVVGLALLCLPYPNPSCFVDLTGSTNPSIYFL